MIKIRAVLFLLLLLPFATSAQTIRVLKPTGTQPTVINPKGHSIKLYQASYALLIDVSDYGDGIRGWKDLTNAGKEMDAVASELQGHGFSVWRLSNPTGRELMEVSRKFIAQHRHIEDSRLIFMFAGHGYTMDNEFGYLVPADAANPINDTIAFVEKALPISQLELWAKELRNRHALFIFDSCFSGTIFSNRTGPMPVASESDRWLYLSDQTRKPVRQFIAAGSANQTLPGVSQFVPLLVHALQLGVNNYSDGYVTGREIGLWISQMLPSILPGQTPHSEMIRDTRFIFGDMVFELPKKFREANRSPSPAPPLTIKLTPEPVARVSNMEEASWMWPTNGKIVATYDEGKNKGIDIAGTTGQEIMAVGTGKVMYVGSGIRGYGNMVVVRHSNELMTAYAHNRATRVKEGQNVSRGQVIAEMGDTDTNSVKLHFEVREHGRPVDPMKFLPRR